MAKGSGFRVVILLVLFHLFKFLPAKAQNPNEGKPQNLKLSFSTSISTGKKLPFWLTTNQNGIFTNDKNSYQILNLEINKPYNKFNISIWGLGYGAQIISSYGSKMTLIPISYWVDAHYKYIILSIGAKPAPIRYEGLSSTNTNVMWSNNARPLPHIQIATNDYIPIFSNFKHLKIKFVYEENFLFDKRITKNAHLHHKSLYLKQFYNEWSLIMGLDHWVFWGGESASYGELPGWENYFRYILGSKGNSKAPLTDQINVSGNHVGNYYVEITKQSKKKTLSVYWNHFFEDGSGKRSVNISDGLWGGALISENKEQFISGILVEYLRTMHQSGSYHQTSPNPDFPGRPDLYGRDNYFNHGVYKSGFTHFGRMMGIPFFIPNINESDISSGFQSTRMWAFHLGMKGSISPNLYWQSMTSFSRNYGTHGAPFANPLEVFSYLIRLNYQKEGFPFLFNMDLAGDIGNETKNNFGIRLELSYQF